LRSGNVSAPFSPLRFYVRFLEDCVVEHAIESFAQMPDGGLLFVPDATIIAHRDLVITLAARHRMPAVRVGRTLVAP
jgi:hypothetical protein